MVILLASSSISGNLPGAITTTSHRLPIAVLQRGMMQVQRRLVAAQVRVSGFEVFQGSTSAVQYMNPGQRPGFWSVMEQPQTLDIELCDIL